MQLLNSHQFFLVTGSCLPILTLKQVIKKGKIESLVHKPVGDVMADTSIFYKHGLCTDKHGIGQFFHVHLKMYITFKCLYLKNTNQN